MMSDYDNDGQMIFGDLVGLKLPDICRTAEESPRKNLTKETCPDRGSNPGPLRDRRACYRLTHSGGLITAHSPTLLSVFLRHRLFTYVTWRATHGVQYRLKIVVRVRVVAVDLDFTTLLTSQVISVAFYSESEKSDKCCPEALISS